MKMLCAALGLAWAVGIAAASHAAGMSARSVDTSQVAATVTVTLVRWPFT